MVLDVCRKKENPLLADRGISITYVCRSYYTMRVEWMLLNNGSQLLVLSSWLIKLANFRPKHAARSRDNEFIRRASLSARKSDGSVNKRSETCCCRKREFNNNRSSILSLQSLKKHKFTISSLRENLPPFISTSIPIESTSQTEDGINFSRFDQINLL